MLIIKLGNAIQLTKRQRLPYFTCGNTLVRSYIISLFYSLSSHIHSYDISFYSNIDKFLFEVYESMNLIYESDFQ